MSERDEASLNRLERLARQIKYRKTKHTEDFVQAVIKDESGNLIKLADIHIAWHEFIREQRANGKRRIGILSGRDFGKTVNTLGILLQMISENTALRTKIITNDDAAAMKRVSSLSAYIVDDPDYSAIYSNIVKPSRRGEWSKHAFYLDRSSKSIDPTVEALGVMTKGTGARADFIWFDDCVDENVLLSPAHRENVKLKFLNAWCNLLEPDAWALLIGTTWHSEDLYHDLLKNPEWTWLIQRVSEDFTHIEQITINAE